MNLPDLQQILKAAERTAPYINKTPVFTSSIIDEIFGASLFFKCENFQKAGSFKSRGAVNAVFRLTQSQISNGVATHSSGNHAAALARAAAIRKCNSYIVMPENSSQIKFQAVKHYGGQIIQCKPTLESRVETLKQVISETGATEVHPYNDYSIIEGQATAALELINQVNRQLDIIICPVGGGGLISGTALAIKYFSPATSVIAAEPTKADDAYRSFNTKIFHPSVNPDTIADGLKTSLGTLTFPIIINNVSNIYTASEESIIEAMKLIWTRMKILIEPSSALPLAILLENKINIKGMQTGIILSGGNVDIENLPWFNK